MRFYVQYILESDGKQVLVRNKVNPATAKNLKELLLAIANNIQCGAEMELPIVGIHITPPDIE